MTFVFWKLRPLSAPAPEQRERVEKMRATLLSELHRTDAAYADTLGLAPAK